MAYTVLARKYRSRTFSEVVGQEPIATTLVNAIKAERIHHGYLFTGTRGVGKTSMARILAKALNCLSFDAPTPEPCMTCDACRAIAEGEDIDVVEIDAASNTGVDNIRELRSNTAYRPARARFKVYIIDEVHMLSTGAFNALLKTLEEPPGHVKFILATTELQKVPATIQSRCQRFNFRNIGPDEIADRLASIVKEEGAEAEDVVVRRVARLANGSMRDALSILDQLLSVSPTHLDAKVLDEILPPTQDEQVLALLKQAAAGDASAALLQVDAILSQGRGLEQLCADTIETTRALLLIRACGADAPMVDIPAAARDEYAELANQFELSQYVQIITMLEELRRQVRHSGAGRALTDAAVVRLSRMREWTSIEQLISQISAGGGPSDEKKKSPGLGESRPTPPTRPAQVTAMRSAPVRDVAPTPSRTPAAPPMSVSNDVDLSEDDADEPAPESVSAVTTPAAAPAATGVGALMPASREDQKRIRQDPVVRQVLELFNGTIVNMMARSTPATDELRDEDDTE